MIIAGTVTVTGISATMTTTETTTGIVSSLRPAGMILTGSRKYLDARQIIHYDTN
jgi:hypothetical protein